jgi:hypothetical protein
MPANYMGKINFLEVTNIDKAGEFWGFMRGYNDFKQIGSIAHKASLHTFFKYVFTAYVPSSASNRCYVAVLLLNGSSFP